LFGHQSGAYTGARKSHEGMIEQAEGGTLFLDEIDSLPSAAQAKLLRFLQEREYRPLGSSRSRRADVRIISASNRNLPAVIAAGIFRQDLFFRVNVLALQLPALRERREDIPELAAHFLARHSGLLKNAAAAFSAPAMQKLMAHDWPGNIRELENVVERAIVSSTGAIVEAESIDLPEQEAPAGTDSFNVQKRRFVANFERGYLTRILADNGGNITRAAKAAEKNRRAFFHLIRKHKLTVVAPSPPSQRA
jgi:DNA-binding NtrC family response regulator